jgi:hypothetical protein
MDQEPSSATVHLKSDLGAVTSNLESILKLVSGRVMLVPECNCLISQILQAILSEERHRCQCTSHNTRYDKGLD